MASLFYGRAVEAHITSDPVPSAPEAPMALLKGAFRSKKSILRKAGRNISKKSCEKHLAFSFLN